MLTVLIRKIQIQFHKFWVSRHVAAPKFVNPYGVNPHLKPYDRPDNPYNTFGKPTGAASWLPADKQEKVPQNRNGPSFLADFIAVVREDFRERVDFLSGKTARLQKAMEERHRNNEKYASFVELAMGRNHGQ